MMSNDTAQLQRFLLFVGMTLVAPIQIIIALVLIYGQVGNATWVGVGFMIFLAPINTVVFSIVSKQRRKVLKFSDLRVKMMNEILAGIRIIKFYAWGKFGELPETVIRFLRLTSLFRTTIRKRSRTIARKRTQGSNKTCVHFRNWFQSHPNECTSDSANFGVLDLRQYTGRAPQGIDSLHYSCLVQCNEIPIRVFANGTSSVHSKQNFASPSGTISRVAGARGLCCERRPS